MFTITLLFSMALGLLGHVIIKKEWRKEGRKEGKRKEKEKEKRGRQREDKERKGGWKEGHLDLKGRSKTFFFFFFFYFQMKLSYM